MNAMTLWLLITLPMALVSLSIAAKTAGNVETPFGVPLAFSIMGAVALMLTIIDLVS